MMTTPRSSGSSPAAALWGAVLVGWLSACDSAQTSGAASTAAQPAVEAGERQRAALDVERSALERSLMEQATLNAQAPLWRAQLDAFQLAVAGGQRQLERAADARQSSASPPEQARVLRFLFSANNHGEREGCRANPLGGLDRRATLIQLARQGGPLAQTYWGQDGPSTDAVFVVDAGESLLRDESLRPDRPKAAKAALAMASAVVEGMNAAAPDALHVGMRELALGLDGLKALRKLAKFPMISANLRDAQGQPVLEPSVVVARGGAKVAFIGLTRAPMRSRDSAGSLDFSVAAPVQAYAQALAALPQDLDAVVLLSNEGVHGTTKLIQDLKARSLRVDLALVSGSNQLTARPVWAQGVPILEPMSRGKHFGRADLYAVDPPGWRFGNEAPDLVGRALAYQQAWSSYLQTRITMIQDMEELNQLQHRALLLTSEATATGAASADPAQAQTTQAQTTQAQAAYAQRLEALRARIAQKDQRRQIMLKSWSEELTSLIQAEQAPASAGEDWIDARVVEVKLAIPQDKATRVVLDRHKGKTWDDPTFYE